MLQISRLGGSEISEKNAVGLQVGLSDWLWTAKLSSGGAWDLQVELPKLLWAAKGASLELQKLCDPQEIIRSYRESEVFPYLSGTPYDYLSIYI